MKDVKIYSKDYCPYCTKIKTFFDGKGVSYTEIDLSNDQEQLLALVEKTKRRSVPQIFVGEEFIGGHDDVMKLESEGKLDAILA